MPGNKYYYRVYSDDAWSADYFFTGTFASVHDSSRALTPSSCIRLPIAKREGNDWSPYLLIYGDMGKDGGAPTLPRLIEEVNKVNALLEKKVRVCKRVNALIFREM